VLLRPDSIFYIPDRELCISSIQILLKKYGLGYSNGFTVIEESLTQALSDEPFAN
jgi:hypothetical protein